MLVNLKLVTPPATEPVSLALAKSHLRLESAFVDDDALIEAYISAAREKCEAETNRAFFNQTWLMTLDHFPWYDFRGGTYLATDRSDWPLMSSFWRSLEIKLPKPKCVDVVSITYVDLAGNPQTLPPSSYYVDIYSEPARIVPLAGGQWPYTQTYLPGSVQVEFVAGSYGAGTENPSLCPSKIVVAIMQLVAMWYENREAASEVALKPIPFGVAELLASEVFEFFTFENN